MDDKICKVIAHILGLFLTLLVAACSCDTAYYDAQEVTGPTKQTFAEYNRKLFWRDSMFISYYSDSLGLNPVPNEDMIWLTVHKPGDGDSLKLGQEVSYSFVVQALTGDTLYTSDQEGPRTISIGRFQDTEGLDYALRRLRVGSVATVIMTPERAFHLRGDGKKIRGRCVVRYDITVLK